MNRMRTMLFCPASQPKMFLNAPVFHPDAILFDLEDAVAFAEKDSARDLLCSAMEQLDFGKSLVFARINALKTPFGEADVRAVVCSVWPSFWMKWRRSTRSPTAV